MVAETHVVHRHLVAKVVCKHANRRMLRCGTVIFHYKRRKKLQEHYVYKLSRRHRPLVANSIIVVFSSVHSICMAAGSAFKLTSTGDVLYVCCSLGRSMSAPCNETTLVTIIDKCEVRLIVTFQGCCVHENVPRCAF